MPCLFTEAANKSSLSQTIGWVSWMEPYCGGRDKRGWGHMRRRGRQRKRFAVLRCTFCPLRKLGIPCSLGMYTLGPRTTPWHIARTRGWGPRSCLWLVLLRKFLVGWDFQLVGKNIPKQLFLFHTQVYLFFSFVRILLVVWACHLTGQDLSDEGLIRSRSPMFPYSMLCSSRCPLALHQHQGLV